MWVVYISTKDIYTKLSGQGKLGGAGERPEKGYLCDLRRKKGEREKERGGWIYTTNIYRGCIYE